MINDCQTTFNDTYLSTYSRLEYKSRTVFHSKHFKRRGGGPTRRRRPLLLCYKRSISNTMNKFWILYIAIRQPVFNSISQSLESIPLYIYS